jgi:hypothetical protein
VTRIALLVTFVALLAFDLYVVATSGYLAIFIVPLLRPATAQVFADVMVALGLFTVWMYRDVRRRGKSMARFWCYLVATVFGGSLGPLVYLIQREWERPAE